MKYVIDFYNHVDELVIDQYLIDNNITKLKQLESFGKVYLVESENEIVITDLIENLSADADQPVNLLSFTIDLVDNYVETTFDIEDEKNWWKVATINKIDFDQPTHTHKIRGANSTVYIIDSGITIDHPEFVNANIELLHTFNGNFIDNNGHGTGLSSLIVGPNCGLANPRLKVVKLFDNTQPTLQSDMLIALDAVLNDFVTNGKKASVVNMSWSISRNDYINAKIQYMINQGMYIVAAAGNSGVALGDVTPASIPDVLTIGSFNQNLEPSSFSNYTGGSDISYTANDVNYGALDGWAPGELIWAANKNGGYGYIAGTSAAAAITSAAIAYNLNIYLVENGSINGKYTIPNEMDFYTTLTIFRENLLDLSNSLYSNSVNKCATVVIDRTFSTFYSFIPQVRAENLSNLFIANPLSVNSISCNTELPEYITISSDGFISISYPEINIPYLLLPDLELRYSLKSGLNSTVILKVFVVNSQYNNLKDVYAHDQTAFSGDDYALNYVLSNVDPGCVLDPGCGDTTCFIDSGGANSCYPIGNKFECNCGTPP